MFLVTSLPKSPKMAAKPLDALEGARENHPATAEADVCISANSSHTLPSKNKLTSEEVNHLCSVMLRAKQFDEESVQQQIFEGQLSKYTNVVKGWQYRWFVINSGRGTLEYFMLEERKKASPRGGVSLAGCQIIPSEEDSQTFTVIALCGDVYKLKASDARNRQIWVNKLRLAAQEETTRAQNTSLMPSPGIMNQSSFSANSPLTSDLLQSLDSVRDQLIVAQKNQIALTNKIEEMTSTDEDLLVLKATTQASVKALEQCFSILEAIHR